MKRPVLSAVDKKLIGQLVSHYEQKRNIIDLMLKQMIAAVETPEQIRRQTHSIKYRIKEPSHLADKLRRKFAKQRENGIEPDIHQENLFTKINDLAGVRLIHLHTKQMGKIHPLLLQAFEDVGFSLEGNPFARSWDDESRGFFEGIGIETQTSETLYTSVHYIVRSETRSLVMTGEYQIRTLMEEVWGEVDHSINYPHPTPSVACREQIRALARSTSAATRLVDAIFASKDDHDLYRIKASVRSSPHRGRKKR